MYADKNQQKRVRVSVLALSGTMDKDYKFMIAPCGYYLFIYLMFPAIFDTTTLYSSESMEGTWMHSRCPNLVSELVSWVSNNQIKAYKMRVKLPFKCDPLLDSSMGRSFFMSGFDHENQVMARNNQKCWVMNFNLVASEKPNKIQSRRGMNLVSMGFSSPYSRKEEESNPFARASLFEGVDPVKSSTARKKKKREYAAKFSKPRTSDESAADREYFSAAMVDDEVE